MANATENLFTLYHFATILQNGLILEPLVFASSRSTRKPFQNSILISPLRFSVAFSLARRRFLRTFSSRFEGV